ncbi:hypothetical protein BKA61DRAFT_676484 [Leptodontidium sp. MPI-SDFR-AT-0119]|nr:hypothetical protein BKA61DRAFT_676484 [Leptodontidium sp. MPI-SDFR-AT-0119]
MTEIADYLLALSSLSKGLHMDNIASLSLARACQESPESVLPVAVKLRNKVLFKEYIMCVINPWSLDGERIGMLEDENIRAIAQKAYDTIEKRANRVLRKIIDCVGAHGSPGEEHDEQLETLSSMFVNYVQLAHDSGRDRLGRVCLPHLFYLVTKDQGHVFFKEASDKWEIDGLMRINESRLAFQGQVVGRDEAVLDHFLNVHIDDADLPWYVYLSP